MYGICGPLKSEAAAVLNYREFWGITTQPEIVTLEPGRGQHRKCLPYAFTEQGVAMLLGSACQPRYAGG